MQYYDYSNQGHDKALNEFTVLDNFTDDDCKMLVKHAIAVMRETFVSFALSHKILI